MIKFNILLILALSFFTACNSSDSSSTKTLKSEAEICPKCGVRNKSASNSFVFDNSNNPKGSIGWLIFWVIFFFPAGIVYYFMRKWN